MIKALLISFAFVLSSTAFASEANKIANAIQNSNTTELSAMFNSSIELVTPGTSGVHSKEQAKMILDNFFKNNVPVKATVAHETNGTTNSMIVISLTTKNGTFRISISGTMKAGALQINEFKIT